MLDLTGRWVDLLARAVALVGGVVLTLIAVLTVVSITGRAGLQVGLKPIKGDFELVEAGTAFVVTAFLPWCQLVRGHASVGIIVDRFGPRVEAIADLVADVLLLLTALLLTWRHYLGMLDKQTYGETTFILQFPLWWAYAACLFGFFAWIVVAAWSVAADIVAVSQGRPRVATGAAH